MNRDDWVSILRCPLCFGDLASNEDSLICDLCEKTFPVRFGIPDFRLFPPSDVGYKSEEEDIKLSAYLFDLHEKLSFEELVHIYIRKASSNLDQALQDLYIKYRINNHDRAMKRFKWIQDHRVFRTGNINESLGLDIGCGCGCGIATLLETGNDAIGIDITISELIIAKSFLKSFYPGRNYFLVAGVAEHLPFTKELFSNVLAIDVIEHVANQKQFIKEAYRVLCPGGCFHFDTASRFYWIEPHTILPAVGYLPRFLQPLFVSLARHRNYKIHLPSLWELRKWLNKSPFADNWKIIYNQVNSTSKPKSWRGKLVRSVPWLLFLLNKLIMHT